MTLTICKATLAKKEAYASFLEAYLRDPQEYCVALKELYEEADQDLEAVVALHMARAEGQRLPEGWTPVTTLWMEDEGQIVGEALIRHELVSPILENFAGHVTYYILPTFRGEGRAKKFLKEIVDEARSIGIKELRIHCDEENIASKKTLEAFGAQFIDIVDNREEWGEFTCRYSIPLAGVGAEHTLAKTGEVEVKGCKLHYRYYKPNDVKKAVRIPLVLLHGGPGACHELWYQALNELSNDRPTLYYDQRGSYYSPAEITAETMTLDQFAEDLEAVVTAAGVTEFALLGHSFGGAVALAYMKKYGSSVRSLIFSSPLISAAWWKEDSVRLLDAMGYDAKTVLRCEEEGRTDSDYYRSAVEAFDKAHGRRTDHYDDLCKKMGMTFNGRVYGYLWGDYEFASTSALKNMDLSFVLPKINAPTSFICGEYDSASPQTMRKAAAKIGGADVNVISCAGHLSFLDNNSAFLSMVKRSLDKAGL